VAQAVTASCGTLSAVPLPDEVTTRRGPVLLRRATTADVPLLVALLADDQLGAARDGADDAASLQPYLRAFAQIDADPAQLLVVGEDHDAVVATLQLSILPGLARRGALRAQVEAVRVAASHRSSGLGTAMLTWAVQEARARGCALVQLTSDKRRTEALRFYERLGFTASHEGFKLLLS
jgi:GNAT superfamily N-acetyltransferase